MPKSSARKLSPSQIIANQRRPEKTVTVCLRADLADEIASLDAELADMAENRPTDDVRMGGAALVPPAELVLAERIHELELEADANSIDIVVRALPRNEWRAAKAKYPANETDAALGYLVDVDDVALGTLTESVVSPELDLDELRQMVDNLNEGQWREIRDAILTVNGGDGSVPFSSRASQLRRLSSSGDASPDNTGSASNGSTDGSRSRPRKLSSGNTDNQPVG